MTKGVLYHSLVLNRVHSKINLCKAPFQYFHIYVECGRILLEGEKCLECRYS